MYIFTPHPENQMNFINLTIRQAVTYSRIQEFLNWNTGILFLLAFLINISLGYELRVLGKVRISGEILLG